MPTTESTHQPAALTPHSLSGYPQSKDHIPDPGLRIWRILLGLFLLALLTATSRVHYLLFHSLAEMYCVAVAWGLFMLVWNTRHFMAAKAPVALGIAYLFVGILDLMHVLAYKGMGVFAADLSANPATQMWIAARYMESISLLGFGIFFHRRLNLLVVLWGYAAATGLILAAVFIWPVFPDCFVDGVGLTPFKRGSEYLICLILAAGLTTLYRRRDVLSASVFNALAGAIAFTIAAEISFTFYISVYGLSNLAGHLFKVVSFFLVYLALIRASLIHPYGRLFGRLESSEAWFRSIFEGARDAVFIVDGTSRFVMVNPAAVQLTGYLRDELLAMAIPDLHDETDLKAYHQFFERIMAGEAITSQAAIRRADGTRVMCEFSNQRIIIDGRPYMHTTARDITDRRQADLALRRSEEKYRNLADHSLTGIYITQAHVLKYCNQAFADMFGFASPRAAVGYEVEKLVAPESWPTVQEKVHYRELGREPYIRYEFKCRKVDGSVFDVEALGVRIDYEGKPAIQGTMIDRTAGKQAEQALKESEAKFRSAFLTSPDSININRLEDGLFVDINDGFTAITGYRRADIIGKTSSEINIWDDMADRQRLVDGLKRRGVVNNQEARFRMKDGRIRIGLMSARVLDLGGVPHILSITRDISEYKQLEAQLQQASKIESVGRLAAGVAHDFNNMLSPIIGYADLLLDDLEASDDRHGQVVQIKQAAERSRDLTRQLLAFSRKQTLELKPLDLGRVVAGFEKLLRRTLREDVKLICRDQGRVCTTLADVGQIEQILMNLAVNAQDAMPDGGTLFIDTDTVQLDPADCTSRPGCKPGRYALLTVRDTGQGMAEAVRRQAFDPFFSTKGPAGTGLGLATVYGIVKQHSGYIELDSRKGQGTTVDLFFPFAPLPSDAGQPDAKPGMAGGGHETILVVEDEPMVRQMARAMLERGGYRVLTADSAAHAMAVAASHGKSIDLLLTDVIMPDMNGRMLADRLKASQPDLKVLFMSGYTDDVITHQGILDPDVKFLQKPFSIQSLNEKVRQVLAETLPKQDAMPGGDAHEG